MIRSIVPPDPLEKKLEDMRRRHYLRYGAFEKPADGQTEKTIEVVRAYMDEFNDTKRPGA